MARILVIDDDQLVLAALSEILLEGQHEVIAVTGDADGAAQVVSADFDLLLTDIFLPWVSGWELIKALRKRHPTLPVIAISGGGMGVEADMALKIGERIGADFVLSKPVDADVLLATVANALKKRDPN
jgi:DNA-binding NtrC family response regulator